MEPSTTLVTGAGGFLGRHVVPLLLARRDRCLRVMLRPGRPLPPWCEDPGIEVVRADLERQEELDRVCQGVATVVHLAARLNIPLETPREKELLHRVNREGTARLLQAGRRAGIEEFLFLSSVAAMGDPPRGVVADESLPPRPGRAYGHSKLQAEGLLARARREWGLRTVILRPVVVYGEGDRGNVVKMFLALRRRRFVLLGGGKARKSLVYAGNVAAAVDHLLPIRPPWEGRTYIVMDEPAPSLAELGRAMARALGIPPPRLTLPAWPFRLAGAALELACRPCGRRPLFSAHTVQKLTTDLLYSGRLLQDETGFKPPFCLDAGLARTARWIQEEVLSRPGG